MFGVLTGEKDRCKDQKRMQTINLHKIWLQSNLHSILNEKIKKVSTKNGKFEVMVCFIENNICWIIKF